MRSEKRLFLVGKTCTPVRNSSCIFDVGVVHTRQKSSEFQTVNSTELNQSFAMVHKCFCTHCNSLAPDIKIVCSSARDGFHKVPIALYKSRQSRWHRQRVGIVLRLTPDLFDPFYLGSTFDDPEREASLVGLFRFDWSPGTVHLLTLFLFIPFWPSNYSVIWSCGNSTWIGCSPIDFWRRQLIE